MADKKTDSKTTASTKPSAASAKPTTAPKTAAKPAATAKPAAKPATTAAKPVAAPAKPTATAAKPATKPAATAKPAAKPATTATAKPASTTATAKPAAKPVDTAKPAAATTATKPAANTAKPAASTTAEKPVKQKKPKKSKPAKNSGGGAEAVATVKNNKIRIIVIAAVAAVMLVAIILGIVLGVKSCNPGGPALDMDYYNIEAHKTNTSVGYYGAVTETVERVKPVEEVRDERENFDLGITVADDYRYPKYGYTMPGVTGNDPDGSKAAARTRLIAESSYLTTTNTWNGGGGGYNMMDAEGKLWLLDNLNGANPTKTPTMTMDGSAQRQLYKHTASIGLYGGDVSDDQARVVKTVEFRPRSYTRGYNVTGLYAPAGEVIKIVMSGADMNATGGVEVHIGQALYNGKANNIWTAKGQMQRFPVILNTMVVNKNTATYDEATDTWTAYVGSFIGGPIYIRNESVTFSATISGGVVYSHFILGYTTKAEFEATRAETTVPYFDLEVFDRGVLHSGPARQVARFSYDQLYNAAILWEKVSIVTTTNGSNQGIVFLYDPFVAAGAAVAFPGQGSVNCPEDWMASSLNYDAIVTSGSWGNFHEYHHNFQNYGVGYTGEVTNNALNLVSYSLFTKISAKRGINNYGAQNLGGWNDYTSATWALQKIINGDILDTNGLAVYATLLHNFGQEAFINTRGTWGASYFNKWAEVTHQNFSYYAGLVSSYSGVSPSGLAANDYPMFVPVSCVYQTGRSYSFDGEKRYSQTMQPFVISRDEPFTIDLNKYTAGGGQYQSGSIILPEGFSYKILNVTDPANGTLDKSDIANNIIKYVPDQNNDSSTSGKMIVTIEITKDGDPNFLVDDVDLVLEFELSREMTKNVLTRTTYTYTAANMYTDAQAAYEAGFAGYEGTPDTWNHTNPTQNCNTDIWLCTPSSLSKFPNADPERHVAKDDTIDVIEGKLYFTDPGRYRIYLRGRLNCAVYYSMDGGKTYTLGAAIKDTSITANSDRFRDDPATYFDVDVEKGAWMYFKEILIVEKINNSQASFIGLGRKQWIEAMFTMQENYYKEDDRTTVESTDSEGYHHTRTIYTDYEGREVAGIIVTDGVTQYYKIVGNVRRESTSEEVAQITESRLIAPDLSGAQPYVNAYRTTYEFPDGNAFQTEYFYTRDYDYDYTDNVKYGGEEQQVISASGMPAWTTYGTTNVQVLVDGVTDNGSNTMQLHSQGKPSEAKPFTFMIDLGGVYRTNRLRLYSQSGRSDPCFPKAMKIYSSLDGIEFTLIKSYTNVPVSGSVQNYDFDETEMRYYKIEITESYSGYIILRELEMWRVNEILGGKYYSPDGEAFKYEGNWSGAKENSSFGHVSVGTKGAKVSFEFTGTRVAFLSSSNPKIGNDFEVYIDGKRANSIELKEDDGAIVASFISDKLSEGTHRVEFRCTGVANIDSIVFFP